MLLTLPHDMKWLLCREDVPKSCRPDSEVGDNGHRDVRRDCSWVVYPEATSWVVQAFRLDSCQIVCRHWNRRKKEEIVWIKCEGLVAGSYWRKRESWLTNGAIFRRLSWHLLLAVRTSTSIFNLIILFLLLHCVVEFVNNNIFIAVENVPNVHTILDDGWNCIQCPRTSAQWKSNKQKNRKYFRLCGDLELINIDKFIFVGECFFFFCCCIFIYTIRFPPPSRPIQIGLLNNWIANDSGRQLASDCHLIKNLFFHPPLTLRVRCCEYATKAI